jgi:hypothetical protein
MDGRVNNFVARVAFDVAGLEVALFFQANPVVFDSAPGVALRLQRSLPEVQPALDRLVAAEVLDVFTRGDGRYLCYALSREPQVWDLLCSLSEAYLDRPEFRQEIVRLLIRRRLQDRRQPRQWALAS